jgi:hypothetical protein
MPFRIKNEPPTYQRVMSRTFMDFYKKFMKIFLDDFTIYSDIDTHLQKFKL